MYIYCILEYVHLYTLYIGLYTYGHSMGMVPKGNIHDHSCYFVILHNYLMCKICTKLTVCAYGCVYRLLYASEGVPDSEAPI